MRLAAEGARVAVLDRDRAAAEALLPQLAGTGHRARAVDVLDDASVRAAFDGLAAHALVHVVGLALAQGEFEESLDEEWTANLDLNLLGAVRCTRAALPALRQHPTSAVVLVSSINALAGLGSEAYAASKAGLGALALNLTRTHARHGVRTNVVAPGTIRTRVWDDQPGMPDAWADWYPLGRVGEPEDVAAPPRSSPPTTRPGSAVTPSRGRRVPRERPLITAAAPRAPRTRRVRRGTPP